MCSAPYWPPSHALGHLRLPFSVSPTAPRTVTVGCSRSHSRALPCSPTVSFLFVSTSDSIRWTSFLRALCRIFSQQQFPKPFFMSSPDFYGYVPFFAVSYLVFLLSFLSHMCPPFLPSCTRRHTVVRRLIVCLFLWFCPCSILLLLAIVPFRFLRHPSTCMSYSL